MPRKKKPTSTEVDLTTFKEEALEKLKAGAPLTGHDGVFTPLLKEFIEAALDAEAEAHVREEDSDNRRNGYGSKRVQTDVGEVEIATPRDRHATFEPRLVPKRSSRLGVGIDRQILALYSRGSSYADISDHLAEMYDVEVSPSTISRITDQVVPLLDQWRSRPLASVYTFVWLDAIHFKVRQDGKVISKAVYGAIGITCDGYKELLGLYLGEQEGARFWLQVLTDLQQRGVNDILIACIDNLTGFAEAIETIFPRTEVQLCVIHQIRTSKRYLAYKDQRAFMRDLKKVYRAATETEAKRALDELETTWGKKYPVVIKSWRTNWDRLSPYFAYPHHIRRMMYTTNMIEGFHRQLRKVTKTKGAFTSDDALMKLLYLVQNRLTKKWDKPVYNWKAALAQLSILFEDRLTFDD